MSAGYSGTPLWKKLGISPEHGIALVNAPIEIEELIRQSLASATSQSPVDSDWTPKAVPKGSGSRPKRLPDNIRSGLKAPEMLGVLFCSEMAVLQKQLPAASKKLHADGTLWISWPKKTSKLFKDLTEDGVRAVALPMGLVDVKVCAMNADWSGLKLMVRKELRKGWNQ